MPFIVKNVPVKQKVGTKQSNKRVLSVAHAEGYRLAGLDPKQEWCWLSGQLRALIIMIYRFAVALLWAL